MRKTQRAPARGAGSRRLTERLLQICDCPMSPTAISFLSQEKRYGRKECLGTRGLPASDFRKASMFKISFHTIVTSRMSWYAPPDTGVPNLQLVSVEYLPSIEDALEIQMDVTFLRAPCRGGALLRPLFRRNRHPRAEQSPAPTARNTKLPRKKVQPDEIRLHLPLMADILRQLVTNLIPAVSGGA